MLGVQPRIGRGFARRRRPARRPSASPSSATISGAGGSAREADALGSRIVLNDEDYTIVGVMPRRFRLQVEKEAVWIPVDLEANRGDRSTLRRFYGLARLAPGVSIRSRAARRPTAIADRLQTATPLPDHRGI